ncbi:MAG: glycosyltransferase [Anaerolineae bacterium]|nr:glycosyltransferase [Anaerolineae bacterium]
MRPSVIIPAQNAERTLPECLDALVRQSLSPFEVIVVDDGSTDQTRVIAEKAGVQVIRQEKSRGPAAARNLGAAHSTGDILCFTDADCEPDADWLANLTRPIMKDKTVAGTKGVYRLKTRHLVARFVQLEYENRYQRMRLFEQIDFIDTYSAAYRRDVFEAAGGFDEGYPAASVEDQEFSFRVAATGAKLVFVPDAVVAHYHVTRLAAYARRKYRIGFWKMRLLRRMPNKVTHDSHTPPTLKIQIVLAALMGVSLVAGVFFPPLFLSLLVLTAFFFASAGTLAFYVFRRDPPVLVVFPFLLLIRAYALGIGMLAGFCVFWLKQPNQRPQT